MTARRPHRKSYAPKKALKDSPQQNYGGRAGKIQRDATNREARVQLFEDRISDHDANIPLEQRKTIWELTSRCCRYPVGVPFAGGFFCGAQKPLESSYCPYHHKIVWVRPRRP